MEQKNLKGNGADLPINVSGRGPGNGEHLPTGGCNVKNSNWTVDGKILVQPGCKENKVIKPMAITVAGQWQEKAHKNH